MITKILSTAVVLLTVSGCVVYTPDPNDPNANPPPPARATERQPGWVKLGQGMANGRNDHDVVQIGKYEGKFSKLRFVVRNSSVRLSDVVVHFANGSTYSPETATVFAENTTSNAIDLPGDARTIDSVNFRYTDGAGSGAAIVEVWGI